MISQKLIAEKAGLSYATVSRAFTSSAYVRPETMQKIRNAMQELGIHNNDNLFLGRGSLSKMVLVVVGDLSSEFYASVVSGIHDGLARLGYSISLCISNFRADVELSRMAAAADTGFAGIIMITAVETDDMVGFLRHSKIPVVLVNRYIRSLDMDVVRIDNYRGGYLAADHLAENGHKRIAHLAGQRNSATTQDRLRGFRDGLADHGVAFGEKDIMYGDLRRSGGRTFAFKLMNEGYTAAFIGNDYMAVGTAYQLINSGKSIPQDVSLICFDDSPMISEDGLMISSISCDAHMMGEATADVLRMRLNDLLGDRIRIILSPRLVIRDSVRRLCP